MKYVTNKNKNIDVEINRNYKIEETESLTIILNKVEYEISVNESKTGININKLGMDHGVSKLAIFCNYTNDIDLI